MTAGGSVEQYTDTVRAAIRSKAASELNVAERFVSVSVAAGSVKITLTIRYESAADAAAGQAALAQRVALAADASAFLTTPALSVFVEHVDLAPTMVGAGSDPYAARAGVGGVVGGIVSACFIVAGVLLLLLYMYRKRKGKASMTDVSKAESTWRGLPSAPAQPQLAEEQVAEERKFVARTLILGKPEEAAHGLETALGLTRTMLAEALVKGEQAIIDEFDGPNVRDEDRANLHYVLRCKANTQLPPHVQKQIETRKYHGGELKPGDYDRGHDGMRLDDFLDHPSSKVAKLERVHVLALRLYTTTSYPQFNNPLRQRQKPHPFAMSVYFLNEGLTKLKAVAATGSNFSQEAVTLWRGMANMLMLDEFKRVGGTELAAMSTSASKAVAFSYANSDAPLVFKYECMGLTRGCSIDFLSVYPGEAEFLYSPLTYICYKGSSVEDGVTVISVEPQRA